MNNLQRIHCDTILYMVILIIGIIITYLIINNQNSFLNIDT